MQTRRWVSVLLVGGFSSSFHDIPTYTPETRTQTYPNQSFLGVKLLALVAPIWVWKTAFGLIVEQSTDFIFKGHSSNPRVDVLKNTLAFS